MRVNNGLENTVIIRHTAGRHSKIGGGFFMTKRSDEKRDLLNEKLLLGAKFKS